MAGIFKRLGDRSRCLMCQKKLVGTEKLVCAKCGQNLGIAAGTSATGVLIAAFLHSRKGHKA